MATCKHIFDNWQVNLDDTLQQFEQTSKLEQFSRLTNDEERVVYLINDKCLETMCMVNDFFEQVGQKSSKSQSLSVSVRHEGNTLFQQKKYVEALECYTKSILLAEFGSNEYGIGLANRSAALFYLKEYQLCITDTDVALKYGYPECKHYKLYQRRGQCFQLLGFPDKTREALEKALKTFQSASLQAESEGTIRNEIKKLLDEEPKKSSCCKNNSEVNQMPEVICGYSNTILQASKALKMEQSKKQGRFLVATQNLTPGDTIIVEKPFAAVLLPEHYETHCVQCYRKLDLIFYPCQQCVIARYCSDVCRIKSWESYHHVECPYQEMLFSVGISALSIRIVVTAGLQFLCDFKQTIISRFNIDVIPGFNDCGRYERNYLTVYDLMTHSDDMHTADLLQYSLTACLLLKCLKHAGFFNSSADNADIYDNTESYIGSLLLRHMLQLVCNAHAITALQATQVGDSFLVDTLSQVRIATAIYPTASLMNHSCDPTIISSFYNETLIVRTVKDVKCGEELFSCYGPNCHRMKRVDRQQALNDQYFFNCECTACLVDADREETFEAMKCSNCEGPLSKSCSDSSMSRCFDCGKETDTYHMVQQLSQAESLCHGALNKLNNSGIEGAIKSLLTALKIKENVLYKYNKELGITFDLIGKCYASQGQFTEAVKFISRSLEITQEIYGPHSIETAYEQRKLAEIQINAGRAECAAVNVKASLQTIRTHYGDLHADVRELEELYKQVLHVCAV